MMIAATAVLIDWLLQYHSMMALLIGIKYIINPLDSKGNYSAQHRVIRSWYTGR